jgi:hypothetical protein
VMPTTDLIFQQKMSLFVKSVDKRWVNKRSMSSTILPQKFCSTCVQSMGSKKCRVVFKLIQNHYLLEKIISVSFILKGDAYNRLNISTQKC